MRLSARTKEVWIADCNQQETWIPTVISQVVALSARLYFSLQQPLPIYPEWLRILEVGWNSLGAFLADNVFQEEPTNNLNEAAVWQTEGQRC